MTAGCRPQERFSLRVDDYRRYRPGYPATLFDHLRRRCGLERGQAVADVGAGTGIFSRLLLDRGLRVFAVEPNADMRAAAQTELAGCRHCSVVAGEAEATTLPSQSVDHVVAAQAFHWFDRSRVREEFARILRPAGWVMLVWNDRRVDSTPFLADYERLLRSLGTDYAAVQERVPGSADLEPFFVRDFSASSFYYEQVFDLPGLEGRLRSSSYALAPGEPGFEAMLDQLRALFARHQRDGRVVFEYDTRVYCGRLSA